LTDKLTKDEIKSIFERVKEAFGGKSADEIAGELDLHRSSVYQWRRGQNPPSIKTLKLISDKTGCSIHWIITGQGSREIETEQAAETSPVSKLWRKAQKLDSQRKIDYVKTNLELLENWVDGELEENKLSNRG